MSDYKEYVVQVYPNGDRYWYKDGKMHREDGPAKEYANGDKYWLRNGKSHREDGPACEYKNGSKFWYIDGIQYTEADFNAIMKEKKNSCNGKIVEIDGKKYKLTEI